MILAHGAVESNDINVKDVNAFKVWFEENVAFGLDYMHWHENDQVVAFCGGGMNTSALPSKLLFDDCEDREDREDCEYERWDMQDLAVAIREHLSQPQEVIFMAVSIESGRYVYANILIIPIAGRAVFLDFAPLGNYSEIGSYAGLLDYIRGEVAITPPPSELQNTVEAQAPLS